MSLSRRKPAPAAAPPAAPDPDAPGTGTTAASTTDPAGGRVARLAAVVLLIQSLVLAVVGVWGLVASTTLVAPSPVRVLGLGMNGLHAGLLVLTALVGAGAVLRRRVLRYVGAAQAIVYVILFIFGSAFSVGVAGRAGLNLDGADHLLHGLLALLGFLVLYLSSARQAEPPPSPPPYPHERTDRPDLENDSG